MHWLEDFLTLKGGICESAKIKKAAIGTERLKVEIFEHGYPRQDMTDTTEGISSVVSMVTVVRSPRQIGTDPHVD